MDLLQPAPCPDEVLFAALTVGHDQDHTVRAGLAHMRQVTANYNMVAVFPIGDDGAIVDHADHRPRQ
jgi:hypothetical protein